MIEQYNNAELEITVGDVCNVDDIAQFQVDMAMESEELALDYERVRRGVQAVMYDEAKGRPSRSGSRRNKISSLSPIWRSSRSL